MMRLAILSMAVLLSGCSAITDLLSSPGREDATDPSAHYLGGGPNTEVELGADEETMLESFHGLTRVKIQLDAQIKELEAYGESQTAKLNRTQQDLDRERRLRVSSEAESERLAQQMRDLQAKVLSMNVERARLEQDLLLLRISSVQRQLAELEGNAAEAAGPAPGYGR